METSINSQMTVNVTVKDVLCGRGGYCHQHPGNRLFRAILKENKSTFEALIHEPIRKQMLVESIVQAIQHHGGRFLRKSHGHWTPIAAKEAYAKVSHALRDMEQSHHSRSGSSSSGSDSSSMTSDEGKSSSSPQHSQFQQALVKKALVQKTSVKDNINASTATHNNKTNKSKSNANNDLAMNDQHPSKRRGISEEDSDDIPELVECSENNNTVTRDNRRKFDTNKENRQPAPEASMDSIPTVISVDESSPKISKNVSFLSDDGDNDDDEDAEEDFLRPLDPDEFVFDSAEEFSHLCVALLKHWGQGQ